MALGKPTRAHVELVRAIVKAGDSRSTAASKLGLETVGGVSLLLNGHRGAGRETARLAKESYGVGDAGWDVDATPEERADWLEQLSAIPRGRAESESVTEAP